MNNKFARSEHREDEKGVVLLIVLILMLFVAVIATDIIKSSRYDYSGAVYLKNTYAGTALLESAAETAQGLFQHNAAGENGTAFIELAQNFNSTLINTSSLLEAGELSGKIEDEESRFPINMHSGNATIMKNVLTGLLVNLCDAHGFGSSDTEGYARNYVDSVCCWTGNGTLCDNDKDDYRSADPGFTMPERPMVTLDELLLINRPDGWLNDEEFGTLFHGSGTIPGLKDLVTPYSDGPMNINTLKREVVMAFVPVELSKDDRLNFYDDVVAGRADNKGNTGWFKAFAAQQPATYKKYIPEVGYSSETARVTIQFNNGIYSSSLMEVFKGDSKSGRIKYKKYGY
ncbi:type II secretion system protein GspK [Desulfovibrio sp. JC022]|uniref:type II secretion system protein GspK n=1 Tax=Desulfovibrio sp. JC022 TaxID=2593642 RepID=UPI0013D6B743|nr:type II secretion system protein GspK [Desulfovibrio sp. JC022]NDV24933.1 general secretion pathway protein GspK [Desulfovibrio sp. JC022]